jgi:uncharacterized protein YoaH (UPF0181 family)
VLYVSGEESGQQIALRARRLALDTRKLKLLAEINLEKILATLQHEKPQVAVIDSIQTLWSEQLSSAPGSVAQVRECAAQLTRLAKQTGGDGHPRRPRDEGGRAGRAARARTHRRYRALFRGRHAFELPPDPRGEEPLRRGQRDRRLRHDRQGAEGRQQPVGDVPVAAWAGGAGFVRAGHAGGDAAACWWKSRRSSIRRTAIRAG